MDKMRWFWVGTDLGGKGTFGLTFVDVSGAQTLRDGLLGG